jgi:hypothetical protein
MGVQALYSKSLQRLEDVRVKLGRGLHEPRPTRSFVSLADEPPVLEPGVQERGPRLGSAFLGHGLR